MGIDGARRALTARFAAAQLETANLDARVLIGHALGLSHSDMIMRAGEPIHADILTVIEGYALRRIGGEPVWQILGYRDFWKRRFKITHDVLTPRPETEGLVAAALELIKDVSVPRILDLGTGSGAVILSLLGERADAHGFAVDISQAALNVARENADSFGVECEFYLGAWQAPLNGLAPFDLIVSNPPYITDAAMGALPREVSGFDPDISLRGGADGLEAYRAIAAGLAAHLKPGGALALEIGYDQGQSVVDILRATGMGDICTLKDLSGHDRIVTALRRDDTPQSSG
ncbi:MAG: peptide chain release factor N(5)-glutamine methyltransferase [Robiginitomaculum sp.]